MYSTDFEIDEVENLLVGAIDTALMAENIFIAAKSYGLGGEVMGCIRNNPTKVVELLNLPKYVIPLFGMCLGFPDDNPWKKPRLPQKIVVHDELYSTDQMDSGLKEYESVTADYYTRRTNGQRTDGWTKQMAKYLSKPRHADLKSFIIKQGIRLK